MKRPAVFPSLFWFVSLLVIVSALIFGSYILKETVLSNINNEQQSDFDDFLDSFFLRELEDDPISLHYLIKDKSAFQITSAPTPSLRSYTEENISQTAERLRDTLKTLSGFDKETLSDEQKLIQDCLLFSCETALEANQYTQLSNPLSPTNGVQEQLPLLLSEYRFDSIEDVDTYLCLLDSVYDTFQSLCTTMTARFLNGTLPSLAALKACEQCASFLNTPLKENILITSFSERLSQLDQLDEIEFATYEMKNAYRIKTEMIPAYAMLAEMLSECAAQAPITEPLGLCSQPGGKEYYAILLKRRCSSDLTVDEARTLLEQYLESSLKRMKQLVRQDSELVQKARKGVSTRDTEFLRQKSAELLPALAAAEPLSLEVKELSPTLQTLCGPAFYLLSPLDSYKNHTIYVNPAFSQSDSYTTLAHEAFPGHLCARVCFLSTNPHPVRSLLDYIAWDEGWATLAEQYALQFLLQDDLTSAPDSRTVDFLCTSQTALLCLYGLTDIGVHFDGWTKADCLEFWANFGIPAESATPLWETVLCEPGYYLPYSMGLLQMLELRSAAVDALGEDFSDSVFCSTLLSLGPMPFSLCEENLLRSLEH